jgi:mannose/cellobiose epimerase-like protein (N-acyl-D-glucosamine 2-epimerase family)
MARSNYGTFGFLLACQLISVSVTAAPSLKPVPTVRYDRVQGTVNAVNRDSALVVLTLADGSTQRLRIAANAYLHPLMGLDERFRRPYPNGMTSFAPGTRIAASGLVYADRPELVAKEVTFFDHAVNKPIFEDPDWWSSQAKELADFWIKTQFGPGDPVDPTAYRTNITKAGTKRPESVNLQETDTISRLIYGLSSTYILNGNPRVLEAARQLVRYQRERFRIESADGTQVYWLHALRDGRPVLASLFADDAGTIPLYEQIYCLAGLTQYYRATGDTVILADIEKSIRFMDEHYWDGTPKDPMQRGYFSHLDPGTMQVVENGPNGLRKNWNSVGDHLPAYLENLYLGTRDPKHLKRLIELADLIVEHFPDKGSPFVNERFDARWNPDHGYAWQQNRGVVGHNLKIAWCLTRLYGLASHDRYLQTARKCADLMQVFGQDVRRGGWYDVIEREPDPVTGRYELVWHDRKAWWQQEQGILAYYVLYGTVHDPAYLASARAGAGFYNLAFPDHDDGDVFFDCQSDGTPYLLGDRADKGSHSKSGYHNMELTYFAHLYTNLLVNRRPVALHFRPGAEAAGTRFQVQPIAFPKGSVRLASVSIGGRPWRNFDSDGLSVMLPDWKVSEPVVVTLVPR